MAIMQTVMLEGAGLTVAADRGGPADGPLVVLQPGGGQTRHSWGRAGERLAQTGYHVLSLDLRGHGDSGWSADGVYTVDRSVDDLVAILGGFGHRPRYLVGASMGGIVSLLAAGEGRVAIDGLVLVDIAPKIEWEGASKVAAFMRAHPDGFATVDAAADAVATYLPQRKRPKDTSGLLKNLRLRGDGRYYWHWDPRLVNGGGSQAEIDRTSARLEAAARALTVPTLLVRGGLSEVVSQASIDHLRAVMPHAEVVEIARADHMVAGDRNDVFNDAVLGFLNRLSAPA